jgi:DNA invertase Pin-like site-specific DNA recombinase
MGPVVDVNMLRGKVIERGTTPEALADAMGISRTTYYRRLKKGGKDFTVENANAIKRELRLTPEEVAAIFFAQIPA